MILWYSKEEIMEKIMMYIGVFSISLFVSLFLAEIINLIAEYREANKQADALVDRLMERGHNETMAVNLVEQMMEEAWEVVIQSDEDIIRYATDRRKKAAKEINRILGLGDGNEERDN